MRIGKSRILQEAVDDFFIRAAQFNEENPALAAPPIIEDLWKHLDITKETWELYRSGKYRKGPEGEKIADIAKKTEQIARLQGY